MKTYLILASLLLSTTGALAQQEGILPGEPDPNGGPRSGNGEHLIDTRTNCPKGQKRFQKMKCGNPKDAQECQNYSPVLECGTQPKKLHCKKPKVAVPVYRCEP